MNNWQRMNNGQQLTKCQRTKEGIACDKFCQMRKDKSETKQDAVGETAHERSGQIRTELRQKSWENHNKNTALGLGGSMMKGVGSDIVTGPCILWQRKGHSFHETCHSVTFYFMKKDSKQCCDITMPESIHTKDESKRCSAFAFIFGVNWPVQWM